MIHPAIFNNVDVIDTLKKIMEHNTKFYQSDFDYDMDDIRKAASRWQEQKGIFWMSRASGTWAFDERDVVIPATSAYRTWRAYSAKQDDLKAFWVKVGDRVDGIVRGSILELDYEQIKRELAWIDTQAESVYLTFRNRELSRSFPLWEYEGNRQSIVDRFGPISNVHYQVKDEAALEQKLRNLYFDLTRNAREATVEEYVGHMVQEKFAGYGYTANDLVLVMPMDAEEAVKRKLDVYGLTKEAGLFPVGGMKDVREVLKNSGIFGMTEEEKRLLSCLCKGQGDLFTTEENKILYQLALAGGISGEFPDAVISSVVHKLEYMLTENAVDEAPGEDQELER